MNNMGIDSQAPLIVNFPMQRHNILNLSTKDTDSGPKIISPIATYLHSVWIHRYYICTYVLCMDTQVLHMYICTYMCVWIHRYYVCTYVCTCVYGYTGTTYVHMYVHVCMDTQVLRTYYAHTFCHINLLISRKLVSMRPRQYCFS
jgi:hypothetical protein